MKFLEDKSKDLKIRICDAEVGGRSFLTRYIPVMGWHSHGWLSPNCSYRDIPLASWTPVLGTLELTGQHVNVVHLSLLISHQCILWSVQCCLLIPWETLAGYFMAKVKPYLIPWKAQDGKCCITIDIFLRSLSSALLPLLFWKDLLFLIQILAAPHFARQL